jgi:hypothetical protein
LIRTRPTIATEGGTGASSDQDPAASSTALRANAATGIPARPAAFADGASQGTGPGQTTKATKMMQITSRIRPQTTRSRGRLAAANAPGAVTR